MTRPYGWRIRDIADLTRRDPRIKSTIRGGGLRFAAGALVAIAADRETRDALELAAFRLHMRASVELHGEPEAADTFDEVEL